MAEEKQRGVAMEFISHRWSDGLLFFKTCLCTLVLVLLVVKIEYTLCQTLKERMASNSKRETIFKMKEHAIT